jgi:DNA-directed RNA polymerase specialized sigma24 family protein
VIHTQLSPVTLPAGIVQSNTGGPPFVRVGALPDANESTAFVAKPEHHTPAYLSVAELIQEVRRRIVAFRSDRPTENACAFELFRRAIVQHDEQAWSGLYELYHVLVGSWILYLSPSLCPEEREALTIESFAKFALSVGPHKFERFAGVHSLMAYLKCCTRSATFDDHRSRQSRQREEPLESLGQEPLLDDPAEAVVEQLAAQELWQIIASEVSAEEYLVLQECILGGTPRELQQHYPLVFPSVEDIYRIKRNVIARLRRHPALLQAYLPYKKVSHSLCTLSPR